MKKTVSLSETVLRQKVQQIMSEIYTGEGQLAQLDAAFGEALAKLSAAVEEVVTTGADFLAHETSPKSELEREGNASFGTNQVVNDVYDHLTMGSHGEVSGANQFSRGLVAAMRTAAYRRKAVSVKR